MRKEQLQNAVQEARAQTKGALQLVYDSLNHGQKQKLQKQEPVLRLLQRFEVEL